MAIKERRSRHRLKKKENRRLQKTIEETLCLKWKKRREELEKEIKEDRDRCIMQQEKKKNLALEHQKQKQICNHILFNNNC